MINVFSKADKVCDSQFMETGSIKPHPINKDEDVNRENKTKHQLKKTPQNCIKYSGKGRDSDVSL